MCKKIGHATNYGGRAQTISTATKVEKRVIEEFQPLYFKAFPAHQRWHRHVEHTLRTGGNIISLMGRKRWFFGRRDDDTTLREAIAYDPQGSLADILNSGLLNVWHHRDAELLMQIHDAILIQYPEEKEDEIIPKVLEQLRYPIQLKDGREFIIPYDCKVGWNWGKYDAEDNQDGLKTYVPGDKRKRTPEVSFLDREFH